MRASSVTKPARLRAASTAAGSVMSARSSWRIWAFRSSRGVGLARFMSRTVTARKVQIVVAGMEGDGWGSTGARLRNLFRINAQGGQLSQGCHGREPDRVRRNLKEELFQGARELQVLDQLMKVGNLCVARHQLQVLERERRAGV